MHWASLGLVQRPPAVLLLGMLWGSVLGPISSRPDAQCQRMIEGPRRGGCAWGRIPSLFRCRVGIPNSERLGRFSYRDEANAWRRGRYGPPVNYTLPSFTS